MAQVDEAEELEVEPDWHQVTALQVLSPASNVPVPVKVAWMASSVVLVVLLTMVTMGILHGIDESTCLSQSDCFNGYWCSSRLGTCNPCHDPGSPFTMTQCDGRNEAKSLLSMPKAHVSAGDANETVSFLRGRRAATHGHLSGHAHEQLDHHGARDGDEFDIMCNACYNERTGAYMHFYNSIRQNIQSMRRCDWATVVLAEAVAVMTIIKHIRDIRLFDITWTTADPKPARGWLVAMWLLSSVRQFAFLPIVLMTVPHLIAVGGGGALRVCLDTVGVLFVLELSGLMIFFIRSRLDGEKRRELDSQVRRSLVVARGWDLSDSGKAGTDGLAWSERIHVLLLLSATLFLQSLPLWVESPKRYWLAWWFTIPVAFLVADFASDVGGVHGTGASAIASRLGRFLCGAAFFCLGVEFAGVDDLRSLVFFLSQVARGQQTI